MSTELTLVPGAAAFDLRSGLVHVDACTHCGLCLESCPTYTLWGSEPDSPRGRIVQIEDAINTGGSISAEMAGHIDSCLGCMACVEACPEDVRYDELLAIARTAVRRQRELPAAQRLRQRLTLELRTRSGRARALAGAAPIPHFTVAQGSVRARVGLLLGCTQRAAHGPIHIATLGVLAAEGFEVVAPMRPDCCGALELHDGSPQHAARRAQATIDAFTAIGGVDHVVVNAGGCGAAIKSYGRLLGTAQARAFSALTLDLHELLARYPARAQLAPLAMRVAYHEACQLRYAQGVVSAPRELLMRIPGLRLLEIPPEAGACCGATGSYAQTQPKASAQLGARQADAVTATGAQLVVSADHACITQLTRQLEARGRPLPVHHPIELLWSSIGAAREAD